VLDQDVVHIFITNRPDFKGIETLALVLLRLVLVLQTDPISRG
jgi:hypothetical protein